MKFFDHNIIIYKERYASVAAARKRSFHRVSGIAGVEE